MFDCTLLHSSKNVVCMAFCCNEFILDVYFLRSMNIVNLYGKTYIIYTIVISPSSLYTFFL